LAYSDDFEWYSLVPKLEFSRRNRKVGAVQLLAVPWQTHASDRFRAAVEGRKLRGLIFGPPGYRPIQGDPRAWFGLHPETLAGRGLDHEWVPPQVPRPEAGDGRLGARSARNDTAVLDRLDAGVAELCGLFPPGKLHLTSFPRVWRGALPDADFCGLAWIPGGNDGKVRSILVRLQAVDALLGAGVLETHMLEPVEAVASRGDARVPILDEELGPLPASLYDLIAERNARLVGDLPAPAPAEPDNRDSRPATPPPDYEPEPVEEADFRSAETALGVTVPRVWRNFLGRIGMTPLGELDPSHPSSWAEAQPDHDDLRAGDDTLPARMLAVGGTLSGDWYSLDLDRVTDDGDCPLLKFDHETMQCVDCWPSVEEFIRGWVVVERSGD